MSAMTDKQWKHMLMVGRLLHYINALGWQASWGDAYRDPRVTYGSPNSLHRMRLAVDVNLFVDGRYMDGKTDDGKPDAFEIACWTKLGEFWESIGGTWGGRFISQAAGDYNHFSLEHNGFK